MRVNFPPPARLPDILKVSPKAFSGSVIVLRKMAAERNFLN
jgi:hypothetical protein